MGMAALSLRVGPPPSPDWTLHYIMLTGIFLVMGTLAIKAPGQPGRRKTGEEQGPTAVCDEG